MHHWRYKFLCGNSTWIRRRTHGRTFTRWQELKIRWNNVLWHHTICPQFFTTDCSRPWSVPAPCTRTPAWPAPAPAPPRLGSRSWSTITGQDWCRLTNKSAAIVLCMYMASIIDNFAINTVGSRQKLQFISKQNNFQTENVYTFAMPTRE